MAPMFGRPAIVVLLVVLTNAPYTAEDLQGQPRPSLVSSARAVVSRKPVTDLAVEITNHRQSRLVKLAIEAGPSTTFWRFAADSRPGPILPTQTRRLLVDQLAAGTAAPLTAGVLVVFEDGVIDGRDAEVRAEIAEREASAQNLSYWIGALASLPTSTPNAEAARRLMAALDAQPAADTSPVAPEIRGWLSTERPSPGGFARVAARRLQSLRRDLDALGRRGDPTATGGALPAMKGESISWRVDARAGTQVTASLEHRGSIPLIAFSMDYYDAPMTASPSGTFSQFLCSEDRLVGTSAALLPGEKREVYVLKREDTPDAQLPSAILRTILLADGTYEGPPDERLRFLARAKANSCG